MRARLAHTWLALLLGAVGWGCAPVGSAHSHRVTWPEGYASDYFRPVPEASAGPTLPGSLSGALPTPHTATGWSLAARDWGSAKDGGFPTPEGLTSEEMRRIDEGWTVARPFEFNVKEHSYVGGVAFQIVEASTDEVLSALLDVNQLPHALPLTHRATLVSRSDADDLTVEVVQGNALAKARYSVRLTRVGEHAIRFSMDPNRPHDIRDARGYFTATPFTARHTLVTVAVGIDLGQGFGRSMFRRQVQKVALSAPAHLRRYVEPRAAANASVVAWR
jgi:hypothetical protein